MMQFFSQLMKLPLEAFVYSLEMFVYTIRGIQRITYQGVDMMADWDVRATVEAPGSESALPGETYAVPEGAGMGRTEAPQITMQEEERNMADKDLRDDMLKLVRYKILFVKRDLEHAFPEREELVAENTDTAGYTAWKIAEFIQQLQQQDPPDESKRIKIPSKWKEKDYPKEEQYKDGEYLKGLPDQDKKYLRVYYEVLERYARERFSYEERQIEILEDIAKKI